MKKITTLIALVCSIHIATSAQNQTAAPDYASIEKNTSDPKSHYYYPRLFKRYLNGDTTIGLNEYKYLYYGYFFHEDSAVIDYDKESEIRKKLIEYRKKDSLTTEDYSTIAELSRQHIKNNPFDLDKLYELYHLERILGDTASASIYYHKVGNIIKTILSTGDGLTEQTAFHVLEVGHEYFTLSALGFRFANDQYLVNSCDYLTVAENDAGVKGLYFDVSQLFKSRYGNMFGDINLPSKKNRKDEKKKPRK